MSSRKLCEPPFYYPCSASPEKDRILMIHGHRKTPMNHTYFDLARTSRN